MLTGFSAAAAALRLRTATGDVGTVTLMARTTGDEGEAFSPVEWTAFRKPATREDRINAGADIGQRTMRAELFLQGQTRTPQEEDLVFDQGLFYAGVNGVWAIDSAEVKFHGNCFDCVLTLIKELDDIAVSTATPLPAGTIGVPYTKVLAATGGQASTTYAWEVSDGTLPAGLSLSAGGTVSGTPTGPAGTASFTVEATDEATLGTRTKDFTLAIS